VSEVVHLDHLGTRLQEFGTRSPLTIVRRITFVDHEVLELLVMPTPSVEALNNIALFAIMIVGLRRQTYLELVLRKMGQVFCMEVAMHSPRSRHIDSERNI
jgi:hypothetical protein